MASKILNLIALSSLAILACSFGAAPVSALSVDVSPNHAARQLGHHQLIAKKKRADTRRCKPRPSTIAVPVNTSSSVSPVKGPSTTPVSSTKSTVSSAKPTSTPKPQTTSTKVSETPKPAPTTTSTKKTSTSVKPTPTPTPTPTPAPSTGSGGSGKAGLAWPNGGSVPLKNFVTKKTHFVYSWSPFKPPNTDSLGLQFAPMFWGIKQASDFKRLVVPGYANVALGQNEPDHSGQANIDPGTGASQWRTYLEPLKSKGYRLVSPAVTSAPSGKTWLQNFFKECSGCTVDAVAVHWYGTDANAFIAYLKDFHSTFGKPLWVTEVACQNFSGGAQCSASQVSNFMNTITAFMDSSDFVEEYFYFGFMHDMGNVNSLNQLMGSNNQPTDLGWNYLS